MNKAGLWEGMKNWLSKTIRESHNIFNIKKAIEAETMQKVLNKMKDTKNNFLNNS